MADTVAKTDAPLLPPSVLGRSWVLERLGSFIGIVPLGIWTAVHLWNNVSALSGPLSWTQSVIQHDNLAGSYAGLGALMVFLVWHTAWGIGRMINGRPNTAPYMGNARYWLQRLSALGLLLFLCAHVYLAKLAPLIHTGRPEPFDDIAAHMAHHLPTLLVYILGVAGIAYHLGNGLSNFLFSFGFVSSQRGFQITTWVSAFLVVAFLIIGWVAVFALWQAGQPLAVPVD